jgi:hypothetical protein
MALLSSSGLHPDHETPGARFLERVPGDEVEDGAAGLPGPEEDGAGRPEGGEDRAVDPDDAVGEDAEQLDPGAGPDPSSGRRDADDVTDGEHELGRQALVVGPDVDVSTHGGLRRGPGSS